MFPTVDAGLQDDVTIDDVDEVLRCQPMDQLLLRSTNCPSPPVSLSMVVPPQISRGLHSNLNAMPYVNIIEQPAPRALRFRYECEGRSAGSIPGTNNSTQNKTYPTIKVENYVGQAVVVVSCVTKDGPLYKPHPHNLVGREGCKKGVCTMVINPPDMICSFTSLGIQCVKKKDIEESLRHRESIKVDPFRTGFSHRTQTSNIDLNVVRLCFQVFLQGPDKDKFTVPLPPVVSEPIYDKKALSDLIITKLSHHSALASGGTEVILLCDRIAKDDVQVVFTEEQDGKVVWEGQGEFQPGDVHKQFAISFRTPRYIDDSIQHPVCVSVQLRRISDNTLSEPRPFQFMPLGDPDGLRHKRQKIDEGCLDTYLQDGIHMVHPMAPNNVSRQVKVIARHLPTKVKAEPDDSTGMHHNHMPGPGNEVIFAVPNPCVRPHIHPNQDIMANSSHLPETQDNPDILNSSDNIQDTVDKLDSLDLGLDANEMRDLLNSNMDSLNLSGGLNLSASLFDSGGGMQSSHVMDHSAAMHRGISTEENLQQITSLHSEIAVLNNLCNHAPKSNG